MFETFLNTIIISVMLSVNCDNPVVIRDDRVYRYVGNGSEDVFQELDNPLKPEDESEVNNGLHSSLQSITTRDILQNIPDSLLIQMKDITNASDFISSFLTGDGNKENRDIYLQYLERGFSVNTSGEEKGVNEERRKLTKLPKIASPAGCVPEMKIIELKPTHTENELYFPSCIRIPRCSGCCTSQRLHCVAINTSFEDITVIRVKYSTAEKRLKFEGFKVFRIEKHDKCLCDCIQKSNDCKPNQIYSETDCRCLCPNITASNDCQNGYNKYWDHNQCQCKCKSTPFCSTGSLFNHTTCRCEVDKELNTSPSDDSSDANDKNYRFVGHRYADKDDSEIQMQNNKGLDVFNSKGINPDIEDDYQ